MYKAQFARWGWSKYNSKRLRRDISTGKSVEKSSGKSCRRVKRHRGESSSSAEASIPASASSPKKQPLSLPYQPAHDNDATRFMATVLTDIRNHVHGFYTHKPDWKDTPETGLISAFNYSFYDSFRSAMDNFMKHEHFNGGEILRQAFVEVEEAIESDYSTTFYFFFIDLPDLFLHYGRNDILIILLGHIKRLTDVKLRDKVVGNGFTGLHALAQTNPAFMRHYIGTASELWTDLLRDLRGPRDRSTLLARRNYFRHARSSDQYRMKELVEDYDHLLGEVQTQYGMGNNASRHLEDVILLIQDNHDTFSDNYIDRNTRLIEDVTARYGAATAPRDWDVLDKHIRSNCYGRLSSFHQRRGDAEKAFLCSKRAREGWKGLFWHFEVETALLAAGRSFEAETLRRCRLESQYFRKLPDNDRLKSGLDVAAPAASSRGPPIPQYWR